MLQEIHEAVPRKLYKAWDSDNKTMVALKLVEVYGFAAASAWADQHLAVPSLRVRYALLVGRALQALMQYCNIALNVTCLCHQQHIVQRQLLCLSSGRCNLRNPAIAENCLAGFQWCLCLGCLRIKDSTS